MWETIIIQKTKLNDFIYLMGHLPSSAWIISIKILKREEVYDRVA
jgi:hypothetical protein